MIPNWAQEMKIHSTYKGDYIFIGIDSRYYRWMPNNKVLVTPTLSLMRYYVTNPYSTPTTSIQDAERVRE